jgi:hypothetical protein
MRRLVAILFCTLIAVTHAQDFRGAAWGATKEQVKTSEAWELVEERDDGLLYRGQVAGLGALGYYFIIPASNQLAAARYVFVDKYGEESFGKLPSVDRQYTADDFRNLFALLSQKYGEPTAGSAAGPSATWQSDTTTVTLTNNEDKDNFFNTIDYRSKELGDEWDAWVTNQNPL